MLFICIIIDTEEPTYVSTLNSILLYSSVNSIRQASRYTRVAVRFRCLNKNVLQDQKCEKWPGWAIHHSIIAAFIM